MSCTPMIVVRDVEASSRWYCSLLGWTSAHGGPEFDMLQDGDGLQLLLHHHDAEEHPALLVPEGARAGLGVLLYVSVSDVEPVFERARSMGADVVDAPHRNPKAHAVEFSVRDPDGYALTVSAWSG